MQNFLTSMSWVLCRTILITRWSSGRVCKDENDRYRFIKKNFKWYQTTTTRNNKNNTVKHRSSCIAGFNKPASKFPFPYSLYSWYFFTWIIACAKGSNWLLARSESSFIGGSKGKAQKIQNNKYKITSKKKLKEKAGVNFRKQNKALFWIDSSSCLFQQLPIWSRTKVIKKQ